MRSLNSPLVLSLVLLAACGGGDAKSGADAKPAADAAATVASAAPAAAAGTGAAVDGAAVFQRCMVCHQATGLGTAGTFPPLAGSEVVNGPAEIPIRIVLKGLTGPLTVKGAKFSNMMMPYGTGVEMSDDEVAAVLTYVRSQWGNTGSAVTAAQVAKERAAIASRTTPWTAAELGLKP